MEFNIYDVSDKDEMTAKDLEESPSTDLPLAETELSISDLRQALMDRVEEEALNGELSNLNINFNRFDHYFYEYDTSRIIDEAETVLEKLNEEDFLNTTWIFENEKIFITNMMGDES